MNFNIPSKEPHKIVIVYLGLRGGGAHLTTNVIENIFQKFPNYTIELHKSLKSKIEIPKSSRIESITYPIPHSFKDLVINIKLLPKLLKKFIYLQNFRSDEYRVVIQIMPSPLDIFFDRIAKKFSIPIFRFVHEVNSHNGERWPTSRSIKKRLRNADIVFCFSNYVENSVKNLTDKSIYKIELNSSLQISADEKFDTFNDLIPSSVTNEFWLIIGRIREYKGLSFFISEFSKMKIKNNLVIAGSGKFRGEFQDSRIIFINRWLSDSEFEYLIMSADLIILPYQSASQSGIIPIARNFGKSILFSKVGGLGEQLTDYPNAFEFRFGDSVSLTDAINRYVDIKKYPKSGYQDNPAQKNQNLDHLLNLLGDMETS